MCRPAHQRAWKSLVQGQTEADDAVVGEYDLSGADLMRHRSTQAGEEEGAASLRRFIRSPPDKVDREARPGKRACAKLIAEHLANGALSLIMGR